MSSAAAVYNNDEEDEDDVFGDGDRLLLEEIEDTATLNQNYNENNYEDIDGIGVDGGDFTIIEG